MRQQADVVVIGQGIAGTATAWALHTAGLTTILVDPCESSSASLVAAGLLTPVTGRRMTVLPRYEMLWNTAEQFYRSLEIRLEQEFLVSQPSLRLFTSEDEARLFRFECLPRCRAFVEPTGPVQLSMIDAGEFGGFRMKPAGRVFVRGLVEATRQSFTERNQFITSQVDIDQQITVDDHSVTVRTSEGTLTANHVVLCQGWKAGQFGLTQTVPGAPVRGDILRVQIPDLQLNEVLHHDLWIVPEGHDEYLIGATYDRRNLSDTPSKHGAEELLRRARQFIRLPIAVIDHTAGVRAGTISRRAIVGRHPELDRVWVVNGMG
ncbi:MAG: FAD-binding oxidoreductase, partial [Planctomycetaceae bacterium]|nr:FAD-binding oxidoreductase [Planctomycetaceae bacterium]